MEIKNRVVIVTGAGGNGSGRAIARRFAREGAAVVASDIHDESGRETVARIEGEGGCAAFFHADVRVEEQVRGLIAFAVKTFGGLDVLVNNASAPFRPAEPLEHWADTVQTDLFGTIYGTRFAIDAMRSVSVPYPRFGMAAKKVAEHRLAIRKVRRYSADDRARLVSGARTYSGKLFRARMDRYRRSSIL